MSISRKWLLSFAPTLSPSHPIGQPRDSYYRINAVVKTCCRLGKNFLKGLDLEDTHLKSARRIEKLIFIIAIAIVWGYLLGIPEKEVSSMGEEE